MKNLYVKWNHDGNGFVMFTKAKHGKHEAIDVGTGNFLGNRRVSVTVNGETLKFDNTIDAIARATQEGYAIMG